MPILCSAHDKFECVMIDMTTIWYCIQGMNTTIFNIKCLLLQSTYVLMSIYLDNVIMVLVNIGTLSSFSRYLVSVGAYGYVIGCMVFNRAVYVRITTGTVFIVVIYDNRSTHLNHRTMYVSSSTAPGKLHGMYVRSM